MATIGIGTGRIAVICAVASGSVVLAIAGVYWYRRFRQQQLKRLIPEDLKKVVATVDKLWVYPLKSAYRVAVEEIECTKRGFVHDRCFYLQLCPCYIITCILKQLMWLPQCITDVCLDLGHFCVSDWLFVGAG